MIGLDGTLGKLVLMKYLALESKVLELRPGVCRGGFLADLQSHLSCPRLPTIPIVNES
jgi:hypothetical protein